MSSRSQSPAISHNEELAWLFSQPLDKSLSQLYESLREYESAIDQQPQTPPSKAKSSNEDFTHSVKEEKNCKKLYKCNCPEKYPNTFKVNQNALIKVCKTCKKAKLAVKCNAKKHCNSCINWETSNWCEISLKFRKDAFSKPTFGNKKSFLCVHVMQNVFEKFNVVSCHKITNASATTDAKTSQSPKEKKPKGNLQTIVSQNENKLPFSWDELKNMKSASS